MSYNIIKLQKVQNKVRFAPTDLQAFSSDSKPQKKTVPKNKNKKTHKNQKLQGTPQKKLSELRHSNQDRTLKNSFKNINREINLISKQIDQIILIKSYVALVPDEPTRSMTPSPNFKITKQSFPDMNFKLPKIQEYY
jgi:hypothetical protein